MPASALDLMRLHRDALFVRDGRGRLVRANQWDGGRPPRLWLGRTPAGSLWSLRADLSDRLARELDGACRAGADDRRLTAALAAHGPVERVARGPTLWLPHARRLPDSRALLLDAAAGHVLRGGLDAWIPDLPYRRPFVASLVDGRAVAVCASARITPEACEAGVETVAAHRGAGHAANAVAGWARAVRELDALPLYSTSWDNAASIGLARKLGFVPYGEELQVS